MTLQQIRYIEMVATTGSISKAADVLYAAQSSVSAAVKEVEKEYSIEIFERTPKGVELTHRGREFLADIQYISNYHRHVDSKYKKALDREKIFSVSTLHHVCGDGAFFELMRSSSQKSYHLGYLEGNTIFVLDNVASRKSDVGIVFFTESAKSVFMQDILKRGIAFHHISYDYMHVYVHRSHPLADSSTLTFSQITSYPFITYDNQEPEAGKYTISFRQWDKNFQLLHVSDRATTYSVLRMGQAYATGSGYLSADEYYHDIVSIPVIDLEKIEIGWLVKDRTALSEMTIEYIDLLKLQYSR